MTPRRPSTRPVEATRGIARATLAERVAAEIRRRILGGVYSGGTRLRQEELSRELGISRIPVREALARLAAEGLVALEPWRGAVVTEPAPGDIEELFELRALLEPRLLRLSAPRLRPHDFADLDALLEEYDHALANRLVERWGELNTAVHLALLRRAPRPRTLSIVGTLLHHSERYGRLQLSLTGALDRASREHRAVVEACRRGDVERACRLLAAHVRAAGRSLVRALARAAGRPGLCPPAKSGGDQP